MLYDLGLITSVAIGGWLALELAMAESWQRRSLSIGVMGAMGAVWSGCELMLRVAEEPWEFALLRRALYFAVAGGTFAWYWAAVEADEPRWFRKRRLFVVLPLLPLVFTWSCLWFAPDGTVISLYSREPKHGPLWIVAAVTSWALIGAGLFHFGRAMLRMRRRSLLRAQALALAVTLPLALNIAYALGFVSVDPAPCLLGPAGLLIRVALIDVGLSTFLPLARSDILEQLEVGVVVAGIDGRVLDANRSAARLLGTADPCGQGLDDLTRDLEHGIDVLRFPLESHHGEPGTAAVLTDRRKAAVAEQRLQLAGRLEAIGSLTAGIAHEVNNPLAYISTNLNTVDKFVAQLNRPEHLEGLPEELRVQARDAGESLDDAQEGFERISNLVARLKGFARSPDEGRSSAVTDAHALAQKAASMAGVGLPEAAIRVAGGEGQPIRGSEGAVTQILVNLLLNAVQASGSEPDIELDISRREDEVQIRVADRGCGIDEEALDQIFDPFYTTKRSGSGLGLSISYDLAERLGGRLEAANRKDGGAAFSLFVPAAV